MTELWWSVALVLLLTIVAGVVHVTTRRGGADSMLAALLFGTAMGLVAGAERPPGGAPYPTSPAMAPTGLGAASGKAERVDGEGGA